MPRVGLDSEGVVSAAAGLADAEGLETVTLARLAAHLGVRSPSLYAHVDGVADLRRRLGARAAAELADLLAVAAAGKSKLAGLRALANTYRSYAREHPGSYAAVQRAPDGEPGSEAAVAAQRLVDVILAVLGGYGLSGDEAIHAVRVVRAALHGFVVLERGDGFAIPLSLDATYERLIAVLDRGLQGDVFSGC